MIFDEQPSYARNNAYFSWQIQSRGKKLSNFAVSQAIKQYFVVCNSKSHKAEDLTFLQQQKKKLIQLVLSFQQKKF
jgi:hypothetical protein